MTARLVFTTCPDEIIAARIARALVERRLAACVTRLPGAHSVYRWQGSIKENTGVQLLIKTTLACEAALLDALRELHPYTEPEAFAVPIENGSSGYLDWIEAATELRG